MRGEDKSREGEGMGYERERRIFDPVSILTNVF